MRIPADHPDSREALNESVLLAAEVLSQLTDGVLAVDPGGFITFASSGAARMAGTALDDLLGQSVDQLLASGHGDGGLASDDSRPVCEWLRSGRFVGRSRGAFRLRDGSSVPLEYAIAPVQCDGETIGAVIAFADGGYRQRSDVDLINARKLEGLGRLAAGIAHEINTPTQYVKDNVHFMNDAFQTLTDLLRASEGIIRKAHNGEPLYDAIRAYERQAAAAGSDALRSEIPAAIEETIEGLDRITKIVRALNEFLHPGAQEMAEVDLNHVIENAVAVCRNEWRYVADVTWELDRTLPAVPCYLGEFSQVMVNIVTNAAHAISDKVSDSPGSRGSIVISTKWEGQWAEVRISDTGTGIPPHLLNNIFDSFFTTKEAGRGTGQGLAIARSVVAEKHGGTITAESEIGEGTTLIVRLPLHNRNSE